MSISIAIVGADNGHSIGDWAALAGVIIAGLSAVIAIHTYRGSIQASSRAHMHSVFRDFLRICIEHHGKSMPEMNAYRFYALEEVFIWLRTERNRWWFDPADKTNRFLKDRRWWQFGGMKDADCKGWINTINFHIRDSNNALSYFEGKWDIYDEGFVAHVKLVLSHVEPAAPSAAPDQQADTKG